MTRAVVIALWCLAIGYVLAVVLSGLMQPVGAFDEPLPWVSALQIRRGLVPHTGFWSPYPPLTYWLLAGVFSLLGESAVAARLAGAVFFLFLLGAAALLARRDFDHPSWRVPYAVLLAALGAGPLFLYAFGIALSACLCAVLSHFLLSRSRPALALIPGLILATTVLMRINFAIYAAAAIVLDLVLTKQKRRAALILGPMLLALLVYLLPYGADMAEVIQQIVTAPQQVLAKTRFIPLPGYPFYYAAIALPLAWFSLRMLVGVRLTPLTNVRGSVDSAAYRAVTVRERFCLRLPRPASLVPLGAACAICAAAYLSRSSAALLPAVSLLNVAGVVIFDRYVFRLHRTERGVLILYALFLHYFLWRADEWHLRPLLALTGLALPFLFLWTAAPARIPAVLLVLAVLPVAAELSWKLHSFRPHRASILSALELIRDGEFLDGTPDSARFLGAQAAVLRPEWQLLYPDPAELSALRYVSARTQENDCVYVGVPNHAAVFVGNIRAYWLLHRCIGVKRFILEPGVTTTESAEAEIATDLQRNRVRRLLLAPQEKGDDAFLRSATTGSGLLDAAIASHYRVAATFGAYTVLTATDF